MTETYTGGCTCGAVRYEAKGDPVAELHCQCRHCRSRSGTGHSSYVVFSGEGAVTVSGKPRTFSMTADSGAEKLHAFCPDCGAPTHVTFPASPGLTAIHPGGLDAPERFHPAFVTYGSRGLAWDAMAGNVKVFEKLPTE